MANGDTSRTRKGLYLAVTRIFLLSMCAIISHIVIMEIETTKVKTEQVAKKTLQSFTANTPKTAIVFLTKALDECRAIRLDHLLQTVPPNMDVWFLHSHNQMNREVDKDKLTASIEHVHRLERERFLYSSPQANKHIPVFDTKASGASMSSFLRWVGQHPEYNHAWHMEDDVFFTGEWKHFFAHAADIEADYVGARNTPRGKWHHNQASRCSMDENYIPSLNGTKSNIAKDGRIMCRDVFTWRTFWSFNRVSTQFAQLLLEDLESRSLHGHHEAIVPGVLMGHANLTFMELPPLAGHYVPGNWGPYKDRTRCSLNMYEPVQDNRYYHPVKCEAYSGEKLEQFKEIMMTYGWSNMTHE
jgi:hypothetical protein